MVERSNTKVKQQSSANNKSFNDQNQTKIVLRRLPPTLTSEQFLETVSPLPDHDYYRFCKSDLNLGQQFAFSRAYLNIPNRQELLVFTEKFQGYVFLDKNGNEFICSVEFAPNQSRPKSDQQTRKDPKVNSIEQDPEYQTFVTNMNAPISAAEALPNAETMLEEIEKKQREEIKTKSGQTTTPLLEYLKRKREERKQEKSIRIQHRNNKQSGRNTASNANEEDYNSSQRYGSGGGDRSNRSQRGYDKSGYRTSNQDQKRSNANEYGGGNKSSKNRESQNSKVKQQNTKETKNTPTPKSTNQETTKPETDSATSNQTVERPNSSQKNTNSATKNRPSIQIYNPGERAKVRRQPPPSSAAPNSSS